MTARPASGAPSPARSPTAPSDRRLLELAVAWMEGSHPYAPHLRRTLEWVRRLDPNARDALCIAAVTHDAERAFPAPRAPSVETWGTAAYERWHQDRSARIVGEWLRANGAADALVADVVALVATHEDGGPDGADVLQAADSLSFLEIQTGHFAAMVARGDLALDVALAKLRRTFDRITVPVARGLAEPMLEPALARIRGSRP